MNTESPRARSLGTRSQDAAGVLEAARELLATPIVTVARSPETLTLIRRHATALRTMFSTQLGYHLIVESSFARLVKSPPEATAPLRRTFRRSGAALDAQTCTLVALACAALLAPGVGEQILISQLVAQIRSDAAEQGIALSDDLSERRRLVAALTVLTGWGVLAETDGTVAQWGDTVGGEALLTVCRPLLPHLLVRSIGPSTTLADILAPDTEAPRRRLRRRLTEDPVVLREDLSAEELDVLSRERSELTRLLNENFGLTLEVRAEGALAYDPAGSLSDIDFPGAGTVKQAALLLIGELGARAAEHVNALTEFDWTIVDATLAELLNRHRRAWKSEYAEAPRRLRDDIVALLTSLRLSEPGETGMRLLAPAFRYRARIALTERPADQLSFLSDGQGDPS
ncbi:TIGR02678 family protein [Nocardia beijingensis]|uniref:TIGR02678 family protein n=1 Tax=Nocardia beijingensis TaxID=95162 RepID=UPI001895897B|nr:TIGR02678 family protein [Nocardia beijingensis]MBF6077448.1 TIGR02678 family protein [Nocardia beijingensis]